MYLTTSRLDIMFAVCAYARHQVTSKECHLYTVKRIFRYLKGYPKLGLWYPKESPFDLVAYSDSDYGGAKQDRKLTTKAIPTEPHHTPSPQEQHSSHYDPSSPSHRTTTTEPIPYTPTATPTVTPTLRKYSRRATRIAQSKALSSLADEHASLLRDDSQGEAFPTGSMQQKLQELNKLCTSLQRQQTQMAANIKDQDLEISGLKARVKFLEYKDRGRAEPSQEDVPIKGDSMEATNILTSGVAAVSVSPIATATTVGVPTVSGFFPTVSATFTTASVVTPYSRQPREISAKDKGKEKVLESKRLSEQLARDSEIARLHSEEELKMMIEGLDRHNEIIMLRYSNIKLNRASHSQRRNKGSSTCQSSEVIAGWKTKHFRGITLEEIKKKFIPVLKKHKDFVPMSSIEESERVERQGSSKRMKTSKNVSEGISNEELKEMMQLVPLKKYMLKLYR
nr:uncharacterized mitochondrial protein AtMg00810-like [Tanacetum cinerariifolium]